MSEIALNYENSLEIDITPTGGSRTWVKICKGFANIAESLNEVIYQASYLCGKGWGSSEVTGAQYICTLTGVRYFGDQAQDFVFSDAVMLNFGKARKTALRVTRQNAAILEWDITLAKITMSGGDANQPAAISVEIHGNGAPEILTGVYLAPLKVVSVPGGTAGQTSIYVNPTIEAGFSYKYKLGASVELPMFDEVLTTGWTVWNGTVAIAATTGQQIVVAVVETASNKAKKGGIADVTTL